MKYWLTWIVITLVVLGISNSLIASAQFNGRLRSIRKSLRQISGFADADVLLGIFGDSATAVALNNSGKEVCFLRTGAMIPLKTGFALVESFEVFHTVIPASQIDTCEVLEDGNAVSELTASSQWVPVKGGALDTYGAAAEHSAVNLKGAPSIKTLSVRFTSKPPSRLVHEIITHSGLPLTRNGATYRKLFANASKWRSEVLSLMQSS